MDTSYVLPIISYPDAFYKPAEKGRDPLFEKAALLIVATKMASTSILQRRFNIGYTRANLLMNQLEKAGIVEPQNGGKPRKIMKQDNQKKKSPFGFKCLINLLKSGKKSTKDHNDNMEIMSFEDLLASLDIYDKLYKFPCKEYDIIGDTTEIDKILNASGIINIRIAEITKTLSKDKVNYISVGYGEGDDAISGAIKEAVENLPLGIDEIARLLIHIWIPPGGMGQPFSEVAGVTNFIETLPSDLDAFFGIARGELPDVSLLKKHKVKVSLIAASK